MYYKYSQYTYTYRWPLQAKLIGIGLTSKNQNKQFRHSIPAGK